MGSTNDGNTRRQLKIVNQACYCNGVKTCINEIQIVVINLSETNHQSCKHAVTRLNCEPLLVTVSSFLVNPGCYQTNTYHSYILGVQQAASQCLPVVSVYF